MKTFWKCYIRKNHVWDPKLKDWLVLSPIGWEIYKCKKCKKCGAYTGPLANEPVEIKTGRNITLKDKGDKSLNITFGEDPK